MSFVARMMILKVIFLIAIFDGFYQTFLCTLHHDVFGSDPSLGTFFWS